MAVVKNSREQGFEPEESGKEKKVFRVERQEEEESKENNIARLSTPPIESVRLRGERDREYEKGEKREKRAA